MNNTTTCIVEGQTVKEVQLLPATKENVRALKTKIGNATAGFDFEKFFNCLQTTSIAKNFIYKSETSSTMDVIKDIQLTAPDGILILTDSQTAGRGRSGRPWSSSSDKNLYFSILLKLTDIKDVVKLNLAIPLSVVQACDSSGVKGAGIKWPNDVWITGKKVSGMLVDVSWYGAIAFANAGVGINVNEDVNKNPDIGSIATSMLNVFGSEISREKVLADFCFYLEQNMFTHTGEVLTRFKSRDILVGNNIIVMPKKVENPERIAARAIGISPEGFLIVVYEGSTVPQTLIAEEVTIRLNQ